ncbi:MAG: hypothetical protein IKO63_04770 [Paludibacteraceae bacterium]|nr:hypothetical protein [Paludibacteraceae bacterium]
MITITYHSLDNQSKNNYTSYYDIDKKDWRAFSVDSLVDITRFWSLKPQAVDE